MDEEDIDQEYYTDAKKQGFKNALHFLQSRGIPLTNEDVFLARPSSPEKGYTPPFSPHNNHSAATLFDSPDNDRNNNNDNNLFNKGIMSPLQQYKEKRAADDRARSQTSKERLKGQAMLTASMIKRKREKQQAKYDASRSVCSSDKSGDIVSPPNTPLLQLNMTEEFITPQLCDDNTGYSPQKISSRADRTVSDVTTPLSVDQDSGAYSLQELNEDLSRMKLTIRLLRESNTNIKAERQLSEEMYQDDIIKLKSALRDAQGEIMISEEKIKTLSAMLEEQHTTAAAEEESAESPPHSSHPTTSSTPSRDNATKTKCTDSHVMVSINRANSVGSTVSAADCAHVRIDDIKGKILNKFGWTEIDESHPGDTLSSPNDEREQKRLSGILQTQKLKNDEVGDSIATQGHSQSADLIAGQTRRRVYAPPGSSASVTSEGEPQRSGHFKDDFASVSVSSLKEKFLKQSASSGDML